MPIWIHPRTKRQSTAVLYLMLVANFLVVLAILAGFFDMVYGLSESLVIRGVVIVIGFAILFDGMGVWAELRQRKSAKKLRDNEEI